MGAGLGAAAWELEEPGWGLWGWAVPPHGLRESVCSWGQLASECTQPWGLGREGPATAGGRMGEAGLGPAESVPEPACWGWCRQGEVWDTQRAGNSSLEGGFGVPPSLLVTPAPTCKLYLSG